MLDRPFLAQTKNMQGAEILKGEQRLQKAENRGLDGEGNTAQRGTRGCCSLCFIPIEKHESGRMWSKSDKVSDAGEKGASGSHGIKTT